MRREEQKRKEGRRGSVEGKQELEAVSKEEGASLVLVGLEHRQHQHSRGILQKKKEEEQQARRQEPRGEVDWDAGHWGRRGQPVVKVDHGTSATGQLLRPPASAHCLPPVLAASK